RGVDVSPLRADDDVGRVAVAQTGAEELLAAPVGARGFEVAHAGLVGGVEDLERALAQRVDRAVRPEVRAVADVEVAGAAEGGEAEPDSQGPARAGARGKGRPGGHRATVGESARMRPAAMDHLAAVIIRLLVAVAILSARATPLGIPYPILLVLGGAVLGFLPGIPDISLDPDLVLVV